MLLTLKKEIIYGPVDSRRLGRSLGVNLMPGTVKVCSFDCGYCQYGRTGGLPNRERLRAQGPKAEDVARAVESALIALGRPPAYITFSGNGEPSLHPDFAGIEEAVAHVRDRLAPEAKTAILSNSSTVGDDRIRRCLAKLDVRIMKLDCGTEGVFKRFNGPATGLGLEGIVEGLAELSRLAPVWIQSLWAGGAGGNSSPSEICAWIGRLKIIRPAFVQVYSLDRDTPVKDLRQISKAELDLIADEVRKIGFQAGSFVRQETGPRR